MSLETMTEDCATYVVVRRAESGELLEKKACFSPEQEGRAMRLLMQKWDDEQQYDIVVTK